MNLTIFYIQSFCLLSMSSFFKEVTTLFFSIIPNPAHFGEFQIVKILYLSLLFCFSEFIRNSFLNSHLFSCVLQTFIIVFKRHMDNFQPNSCNFNEFPDFNFSDDQFQHNIPASSSDLFDTLLYQPSKSNMFDEENYSMKNSEQKDLQEIFSSEQKNCLFQKRRLEEEKNQKSTMIGEDVFDFAEDGEKDNEEPEPKLQPTSIKIRDEKKKKKTCDDTKNLLINFRSFFIDYIKEKDTTAEFDPFIQNFSNKKSINRCDYEELFKNERYKPLISQMFRERFLQRQFQLSRSSPQVRPIYLKKISVFRKAFQLEWFPRIR